MQIQRDEQSIRFSKETSWDAVRAAKVPLIHPGGAGLTSFPVRTVCRVRLTEDEGGQRMVERGYFVEVFWSPSRREPCWRDITSRLEDYEAAPCLLFNETDDEGNVIEEAMEALLWPRLDTAEELEEPEAVPSRALAAGKAA